MMKRVAVIGLGRMGWAIAEKLAREGVAVIGWTRSGAASDVFSLVPSLAEAVAAANLLILSLFEDRAVCAVLEQLTSLDLRGRLVVETSTVSPAVVRDMARGIEAAGAFHAMINAIQLGNAMGPTLETMLTFLKDSPATNPMFRARIPKMTGEDEMVGFAIDAVMKDNVLFVETAGSFGVNLPDLHHAHARLKEAIGAGHGGTRPSGYWCGSRCGTLSAEPPVTMR